MTEQVNIYKNIYPDTLRRMHPQLANMSDDQIKAAATQFEMMTSNPEMMKMATDQMKNMTPEQMRQATNLQGANYSLPNNLDGDPSKLLANMDKKQMRQMLTQVKDNPEMMKQFAAMSGMKEDQLAKGVETFANMDDKKMDLALSAMSKMQKAKDSWNAANAKTGGHLIKLLVASALIFVIFIVHRLWYASTGLPIETLFWVNDNPTIETTSNSLVEDEFTEF